MALSDASALFVKMYHKGELYKLYVDEMPFVADVWRGTEGVRVGLDNTRFALTNGVAGRIRPGGEATSFPGASGTTGDNRTEPSYDKIELAIVQYEGSMQLTTNEYKYAGTDREMFNTVTEKIRSHYRAYSRIEHITQLNGASGIVLRADGSEIVAGPGTANVSWKIPLNRSISSESYRWFQNGNALLEGLVIEFIDPDTQAVLADSTPLPYIAECAGASADGSFILVNFRQAMADTATDLAADPLIRLEAPGMGTASGFMYQYGFADIVNGINAKFVNDAGTQTNTFPYRSTENGIDPDVTPEWQSNETVVQGATTSVNDFDEMFSQLQIRGYANPADINHVFIFSTDMQRDLNQEAREYRRSSPLDRNDQTPMGRNYYDDKALFHVDPYLALKTCYLLDSTKLMQDPWNKNGLDFVNPVTGEGVGASGSGGAFLKAAGSKNYIGDSSAWGQNMCADRKCHGRLHGDS